MEAVRYNHGVLRVVGTSHFPLPREAIAGAEPYPNPVPQKAPDQMEFSRDLTFVSVGSSDSARDTRASGQAYDR